MYQRRNAPLSMRWGDKIPYKEVVVVYRQIGNSANASVSVARLDIPVNFISFVGVRDRHGEECISALQDEGVGTTYITKETGKNTNYHYILSYEA